MYNKNLTNSDFKKNCMTRNKDSESTINIWYFFMRTLVYSWLVNNVLSICISFDVVYFLLENLKKSKNHKHFFPLKMNSFFFTFVFLIFEKIFKNVYHIEFWCKSRIIVWFRNNEFNHKDTRHKKMIPDYCWLLHM